MARLREEINPDEEQGRISSATKHVTDSNRYGLHCAECGEFYYVDESIMRLVKAAQEGDAEMAFRCDNCMEEYGEEESRP